MQNSKNAYKLHTNARTEWVKPHKYGLSIAKHFKPRLVKLMFI